MISLGRLRTSPCLHLGIVCFGLLVIWAFAGCGDSEPTAPTGGIKGIPNPPLDPLIGTSRPVYMTARAGSELRIGGDPALVGPDGSEAPEPLKFNYDARGPGSVGTVTYLGGGKARLEFKAEDMTVTDLEMPLVPKEFAYVKIIPSDQVGEIDFCTGEVSYGFDSKFHPVTLGQELDAMSVVTTLTTGTSKGGFTEVTGEPMDVDDRNGDMTLVSVAQVPLTDDELVNALLNLPTDAVSILDVHYDFPEGWFPCPTDPDPGVADRVRMRVGKDAVLSMDFLGFYTQFPYDGGGSDGSGTITGINNGVVSVEFSNFVIPDLKFVTGPVAELLMLVMPFLDEIGLSIDPKLLKGEIDLCTGRVELNFDADFTSYVLGEYNYPMRVATPVTTGEMGFHHHPDLEPLHGTLLDQELPGNARLVGVADVPAIELTPESLAKGAIMINAMLGLPNDAVCELPVHLDFLGGEPPTCPN